MATLTYDSTIWGARDFSMLLRPNVQAFTSPLTNSVQTAELPWPKWEARWGYDPMPNARGRALDAYFRRVGGPAGRILMWDLEQPLPTGTQRGTLTLNGAHAQGATTLNLSGTTNGATLKAGDKLGVGAAGGQVVEVAADVTFAGATGSVTVVQSLKAAQAGGVAIEWNAPKFTGMLQTVPEVVHSSGISRCSAITLIEMP